MEYIDSNSSHFFESFFNKKRLIKAFLINMFAILITSAKMATLGLLKRHVEIKVTTS